MMRLGQALLFWVFLFAAGSAGAAERLVVRTQDGRDLTFSVEIARSPEQLEQGLMNRPSLAADAGMLFDFGTERMVAMWMKNTMIPLDMLFVAKDGRVSSIARRTVPYSLSAIPSSAPVRYVLEINGGVADRLGIGPGDRLVLPPG